jgi:hypothetical protein
MGAEQALDRLGPILAILYTLIEEGVEGSRAWFQARGKPIHNVVFASHVRLRIWEEVEERMRAAGIDCSVLLLANVGVRVRFSGTTIAIWKSDKDGKLPACGKSQRRQLFYSQTTLPHMYGSDALPSKLAILWENDHGVLAVKLVCPKGYTSFWKAGVIHWEVDVPHPAKTLAASTDHLASGAEELDEILKHKKTADESDGKR